MKKVISSVVLLLIVVSFYACDIHDSFYSIDNQPPLPPSGISVLNGDNRVDISWQRNRESDLAGYNVYYSYSYNGKYTRIGSTTSNYFVDYDVNNGNTYYYAVTAYDFNGNESDLSYDVIYSTPRPEGFNQAIFDYNRFPQNAGYSFSKYKVVAYNNQDADFFFENYNGTFYLDVWDDTDIQDAGLTYDIYDVLYAPTTGWSTTKDVIAKIGHTYVIWTWNNHYAKVRIKSITNDRIVFDWAYQLVEGNTQLKPKAALNERGELTRTNR